MNLLTDPKKEKKIMLQSFAIAIIEFSIITIYTGDFLAITMGLFSIFLIWYAYFIIRKYFPDGDKYILILSAFLIQIGLMMLYRINPYIALRQLTWFTMGISIFILITIFLPDIEVLQNLKKFYIISAIGLLLITQIFASEINGSKNWIDLGFASFQPSEFSKILLIFYLSSVLKDFREKKDLILPCIAIFICLIFLVFQKDLGSALIFFCISITLVYIGTSKLRYVFSALVLSAMGGILSYKIFNHVRQRIYIWINPWRDANDSGYQIIQSLYAIASGGFIGTGLCLGHPSYIPVVSSDFIFSIICEELGILGGFAIILTYFLLIYRGFRTAIYAEGYFSKLVAAGISTMIGAQVFVIIGGVIKLIPLTGITLPLISYGGSSILINFIALGVLQKISETSNNKA